MSKLILYIHGMGGGASSRIPAILKDVFSKRGEADICVKVKTYDFDPEAASLQISSWVKESSPSLIIGESLGAVHAIKVRGLPHILVSPSLGAPLRLSCLSPFLLIPGFRSLMNFIY